MGDECHWNSTIELGRELELLLRPDDDSATMSAEDYWFPRGTAS